MENTDDRPAHTNGRTLSDREMDTIVGKNGKGAIVTLVEKGRVVLCSWKSLIRGSRPVPLAHTVVRLLMGCGMPVRTITTDNKTEFAAHKSIA